MSSPRVLIAGASIAGPAVAFWLHRYGWQPVVLERAPGLRDGGQNIDVRGAGREVARRMGVEDAIRARSTGELGTRFLRPDGGTIAEFPAGTTDSGGPTAELEILRGDLARLLVEQTTDDVEYRFGDAITAIEDRDDEPDVAVSFAHAPDERFDLVIAADGIGSSTRTLVFGGETPVRSLGMETTWATIPRTAEDTDWWRWCNAPGGRSMTLRPDPVGTTRATLSIMTGRNAARSEVERRSRSEQRALLRERFADAGWQAPGSSRGWMPPTISTSSRSVR